MTSNDNAIIPMRESKDVINDEISNTINKFIEYSLKNGPEFEKNVKSYEAGNKKFEFLIGGVTNIFYRWKLYTMQQQLSTDQIEKCLTDYGKYIEGCKPGYVDLLDIDRFELRNLLQDNTGSRNDISKCSDFCLERAHSAVAIGQEFAKYTYSMVGNLTPASVVPIGHLMKIVSVLNDIIFKCSNATMFGAYTSTIDNEANHPSDCAMKKIKVDVIECIWDNVCFVLAGVFFASQLMNMTENQQKLMQNSNILLEMVEKWEKKQKITANQKEFLVSCMKSTVKADLPVFSAVLQSPGCPVNILPVARAGVEVLQTPVVATKQRIEPPAELFSPYGPVPPGYAPQPPPVAIPPAVGSNPPMPHPGCVPYAYTSVNPPFQYQGISPGRNAYETAPEVGLQGVSVGRMVDILKSAGHVGNLGYTPLDLSRWLHAPVPRVEPARLEVRVSNFYKKLAELQNTSASPSSGSFVQRNMDEEPRSKRSRSSSIGGTSESVAGYGVYGSFGTYGDRKLPSATRKERYQILLQEDKKDETVTSDNIGHTMLKGMGWSEGKGLGSTGSGIQAPVSVVSNKSRSGIGSFNR